MTSPRWPLRIYQSIPTNWRERLQARFDPDGAFYVGIPGVLHGRPEIGFYAHQLGAERVLEFRTLIEQKNLWSLPNLDVIAPERPNVLFMEGDGDDVRSVMWSIDAIPSEVLSLLDVFNRLVEEAYASPRWALAGEARWGAPSFSAREPLQIQFELRNKGSESICVQNPKTPQGVESRLQLIVTPARPPPGRTPTPRSLVIRPTRHAADSPRPTASLELAPAQAASFTESPSVYLSPGEYQAVLIFDTGWDSRAPRNHVRGVLALELPPLHIVHR